MTRAAECRDDMMQWVALVLDSRGEERPGWPSGAAIRSCPDSGEEVSCAVQNAVAADDTDAMLHVAAICTVHGFSVTDDMVLGMSQRIPGSTMAALIERILVTRNNCPTNSAVLRALADAVAQARAYASRRDVQDGKQELHATFSGAVSVIESLCKNVKFEDTAELLTDLLTVSECARDRSDDLLMKFIWQGLRLCVSHWTQPVFDYLLTRIAEGARSLDARGYKVAVFYATNLRMYVDQASDSSLHAMGNLSSALVEIIGDLYDAIAERRVELCQIEQLLTCVYSAKDRLPPPTHIGCRRSPLASCLLNLLVPNFGADDVRRAIVTLTSLDALQSTSVYEHCLQRIASTLFVNAHVDDHEQTLLELSLYGSSALAHFSIDLMAVVISCPVARRRQDEITDMAIEAFRACRYRLTVIQTRLCRLMSATMMLINDEALSVSVITRLLQPVFNQNGGTGSIAHAYFLRIVQLHQVLQSSEQYEAFAKPAISFLIRSANNVSRMGSSSRELAPYADMLVGLEGVCAALRCSRFRQSLTTMSEWRLLVGLLLQLLDGMIIPLRSRSIFYCVIEAAILSTPLLSSREQEELLTKLERLAETSPYLVRRFLVCTASSLQSQHGTRIVSLFAQACQDCDEDDPLADDVARVASQLDIRIPPKSVARFATPEPQCSQKPLLSSIDEYLSDVHRQDTDPSLQVRLQTLSFYANNTN
ncbi:Uncharacterized protein PBTT_04250 [Plasmodiophora brassicae]